MPVLILTLPLTPSVPAFDDITVNEPLLELLPKPDVTDTEPPVAVVLEMQVLVVVLL